MRIGVAHPERLTREAIRRAIGSEHSLTWFATDARELDKLRRREPVDLILVDASLVDRNAVETRDAGLQWLVLAADDSIKGVYEALSAGALGHIAPPQLESSGELVGAQRLLTRLSRLQALVGDRAKPAPAPAPGPSAIKALPIPVIGIGASTGGPQALARVLAGLPAGLQAAVMIVQHIDADFSTGLVEWLASHSLLPVQIAKRGESIEPGRVYLGANQGHLVLLPSQQISYLAPMKHDLHVPSVDTLFAYLAQHQRPASAALLTGMGSDGAAGLLKLRQSGWYTIAQDEASSAVYGMPRAAAECGAAMHSLPIGTIGQALARHLNGAPR
jgi:two-component system response regulator WspF